MANGYSPTNANIAGSNYQTAPDRVTLSSRSQIKHEEKNEEKTGIGAKVTLGFCLAAATIVALRKGIQLLSFVKLAEHIDFKKADTVEEAIEFGRKHLKINKYEGFEANDVEVVNWVNEGLVNVSNRYKGRLRMPGEVIFGETGGFAGVRKDRSIVISKKHIENLHDTIQRRLSNTKPLLDKVKCNDFWSKYTTGEVTTLKEKIRVCQCIEDYYTIIHRINNPKYLGEEFRNILSSNEYRKIIKEANLEIDINKISKMTEEEQCTLFLKMLDKLQIMQKIDADPFKTIYWLMGHVQDKYFIRPESSWVGNEQYQDIALKVSNFATKGPRDFIAETFAKIMTGEKLPDDVMELYNQFIGPKIPV